MAQPPVWLFPMIVLKGVETTQSEQYAQIATLIVLLINVPGKET